MSYAELWAEACIERDAERALADDANDLFDRIVEDLGLGEGYGAEVDAWQARWRETRQQ